MPQSRLFGHALRPLLNRFGDAPGFTLVVRTLDESTYAGEPAPLAGVYPALRIDTRGFDDSPEAIRRLRGQTTETAGFRNTVGFNQETRAFVSTPARHGLA